MIILVGMSSMKRFYKNRSEQKKLAHTLSPFSSAPFCQRDLMYPLHIGPECAEFSRCLDAKSSQRLLRNPVELG